jgi:hypothetical protein
MVVTVTGTHTQMMAQGTTEAPPGGATTGAAGQSPHTLMDRE